MEYKRTGWAVLLTFILTVPASVIGFFVSRFYMFIASRFFDGGGLVNWATAGWFDKITLAFIPSFLHGFVGGGLALFVCFRLLKFANYEIVAYSVSSVCIALAITGLALGISFDHPFINMVNLASNFAGIVAGLFALKKEAEQNQISNYLRAGREAREALSAKI